MAGLTNAEYGKDPEPGAAKEPDPKVEAAKDAEMAAAAADLAAKQEAEHEWVVAKADADREARRPDKPQTESEPGNS